MSLREDFLTRLRYQRGSGNPLGVLNYTLGEIVLVPGR
tara:strand:- start:538 stop:651 length:114 start_codon:yes stop_codon:yes gene_type:complete